MDVALLIGLNNTDNVLILTSPVQDITINIFKKLNVKSVVFLVISLIVRIVEIIIIFNCLLVLTCKDNSTSPELVISSSGRVFKPPVEIFKFLLPLLVTVLPDQNDTTYFILY